MKLLAVLVAMARVEAQDPEPQDYFPLNVGARWDYRVTTTAGDFDLTVDILGTVHVKDGDRYVAAVVADPFVFIPGDGSVGHFAAAAEGVRVFGGSKVTRQPGLFIKYPLKNGDTWDWKDSLGVRTSCATEGEQEVEVPAGKFKAVRITWRGETRRKEKFSWDIWLAKGTGVVMYDADTGQGVKAKARLKSFERESKTSASVRACIERAEAKQKAGDLDAAMSAFDEALGLSAKHAARAYLGRGRARLAKGDIAGALDDLAACLKADPNDPACLRERAGAYLSLGRDDEALSDLDKSIEVDPKQAEAYALRGSARDRRGEGDKAIDDLTRALELDPSRPEWLANRGRVRAGMGDKEGARADLRKALDVAPKDWRHRAAVEAALRKLEE